MDRKLCNHSKIYLVDHHDHDIKYLMPAEPQDKTSKIKIIKIRYLFRLQIVYKFKNKNKIKKMQKVSGPELSEPPSSTSKISKEKNYAFAGKLLKI